MCSDDTGRSDKTMKITVYGAEGEIGQKVISYALSKGDFVTACICDARILWPRKNLTVIEGTVTNREKVMEAMLEADIVISALTCEDTGRKNTSVSVSDGTATIISAMEQLGKSRLVVLGSICIQAFGDQQNFLQRFHPRFAAILYSERLRDIQKTGQFIVHSHLNWTMVRAAGFQARDDGKGYGVSLDGSHCGMWVSRNNVARFLYDAAVEPEKFNRKMPIVYNRS